MAPRKYPLLALVHVRERRTDEAARDLATAIREREAEERRRRAAESEREATRALADSVRGAERVALEHGELSAGDLSRAQAWELRAKEDLERASRQVEHAGARETAASAKEEGAKSLLAKRNADQDVVEAHRDRFRDGERKREEASDEEAGAEAWRPRRT